MNQFLKLSQTLESNESHKIPIDINNFEIFNKMIKKVDNVSGNCQSRIFLKNNSFEISTTIFESFHWRFIQE